MATKKPAASAATKEPKFSKVSLAESKRFRDHRDLVEALLSDGKTYTISEVQSAIDKFLKGKVR